VLFRLVRALLARGDPEQAYRVGTIAQFAIASLTKRLQVEEATRLHRGLLALAREEARRDTDDADKPQVRLRRLAAVNDFAGGIRSMIVSLSAAAENLTPDEVAGFAAETAVQQPGAPLGRPIPPLVRDTIVSLRKRLSFELAAEGRRVTPDWYLADVTGIAYARFMVSSTDRLVKEVEEWYPLEAEALLAEGRVDFAIHTIQTGLDLCGLLLHHAGTISTSLVRLASLSRQFLDQPWPNIDREKVTARLAGVRDRLLATLAIATPHLPTQVPNGELPDITGFAYTVLAQECYSSLAENRHQLFRQLYPAFFGLVISVEKRLWIELEGLPDQSKLVVRSDLMMDLLEISGFALVFHDLDGGSAWESVTTAWERLLSEHPNPAYVVDYALKMFDFRRGTHMMSTRYMVRTSWLQDFQRRMTERGFSRGWLGDEVGTVEPLQLIAAVMVRGGLIGLDAADPFVAGYLLKLPQAAGLAPPDAVRDFRERLRIEQRRRQTAKVRVGRRQSNQEESE
jgi:hypothetical protein